MCMSAIGSRRGRPWKNLFITSYSIGINVTPGADWPELTFPHWTYCLPFWDRWGGTPSQSLSCWGIVKFNWHNLMNSILIALFGQPLSSPASLPCHLYWEGGGGWGTGFPALWQDSVEHCTRTSTIYRVSVVYKIKCTIHLYVFTCMYVCMYVCMYACILVCVCMYNSINQS